MQGIESAALFERINSMFLKKALGDKFPALEVVSIDDVASCDLIGALSGTSAVIHAAGPLPFGAASPKENLQVVIDGYLNVLRQAVSNGISKVVLTGSWASAFDPDLRKPFEGGISSEKDWGNVTEEEFIEESSRNPSWAYIASKTLAERAAWKYARMEPKLDLSIVAPPFMFGPYVAGFPYPALPVVGSNQHIYTLLNGSVPPPLPPVFCDVRDVALAHVKALKVPKSNGNVEDKRFFVSSNEMIIWKEVNDYLHTILPAEVKARLPAVDSAFPPLRGTPLVIDTTRARQGLGMSSYRGWKECIGATIEGLLEAEKA